jgi:hypothetical protein
MNRPQAKLTQSHPIRLAALMLAGAFVGDLFTPTAGRLQDVWGVWSWVLYPVAGAVLGLFVELVTRAVRLRSHDNVRG